MGIRKGVTVALTGLIALILLVPSAALAQESLFLKLEGIPGESLDATHAGEINLLSYSQSFTNPGSPGRGVGTVQASCGAIIVTKVIDRSSPRLIGAVLRGDHIPTGVITFRTNGQNPFEYYTVALTDVLINAIGQTDAAPPTDPTTILEQISMTARAFSFRYNPQSSLGTPLPPVTFSWNCDTNKAQ